MQFGTVDYTRLARTKANLQDLLDRKQQSDIDMANLRAQTIARAKAQQQQQGLTQLGNEFSSVVGDSGMTPEEVNKRLLTTRVKAVTGDYGPRGVEFGRSVDDYLRTQTQRNPVSTVQTLDNGGKPTRYQILTDPQKAMSDPNYKPVKIPLGDIYQDPKEKEMLDLAKQRLSFARERANAGDFKFWNTNKRMMETQLGNIGSLVTKYRQAANTATSDADKEMFNSMADDYTGTVNELQQSYDFINQKANESLGQSTNRKTVAPTQGKALTTRPDGKVKVKLGDGRVGFLDPKEFNSQTMEYVK